LGSDAQDGARGARSAAGGSANTSGESFRADVAAFIAIRILAQTPIWNHSFVDAVPLRLHCEAAEDVDDIAVSTRLGRLLFQAKGDEKLNIPPDARDLKAPLSNHFVKAIAQLVSQQTSGDAQRRPLDEAKDRFVLAFKDATDDFKRLRKIAERVAPPASVPDEESRARLEVLRSEDDQRVFERFEKVVHCLRKVAPTWSDIIALLRISIFWPVHEGITHRIEVDPGNLLRSVLADGGSCQNAIDVLSREIITLAAVATGIDMEGLRAFLGSRQFRLQATPDCSRDVQRILDSTSTIVANIRLSQRPVFGPPVDRRAVSELLTAMEIGPTVLLGDRGMGKSNVILAVYDELKRQDRNVIVCDLKQATPQALVTLPTGEALTNPLNTILASFPGPRPTFMLIDGLEEAAADRTLEKILYALIGNVARDQTRWRLLVASRPSILQGRREWREFFDGTPVRASTDDVFGATRHLRLGAFTTDELQHALAEAPAAMKQAVFSKPSIQDFVAVPETLALLRDLPNHQEPPAGFYAKAVLDLYWGHRVHSPDRQAFVIKLARAQRARNASALPVDELDLQGTTLSELREDGVIVVASGRVSFAHEQLADYIHARFSSD
jgi:hypothetical protein